MRPIVVFFLFLPVSIPTAALAAETADALGPGTGISSPLATENPCPGSIRIMNADGTWENAYTWSNTGVEPPDYGGFVEGYSAIGVICGVQLHLSARQGDYADQTMDLYVYGSDGEFPSEVLGVSPGLSIDPPGIWPQVTAHDLAIDEVTVAGEFFVGYWPDWPGEPRGWYCAADLNGPGGRPRTRIAPGSGYPSSGWHHVSEVWGPTQAMGVGVYVVEEPTPVLQATWGSIKRLFP